MIFRWQGDIAISLIHVSKNIHVMILTGITEHILCSAISTFYPFILNAMHKVKVKHA